MRSGTYQVDNVFYQRLPGSRLVLRCNCQDEEWASQPADLPPAAREVALADLPAALQEEVLATLVRAQAMGNPFQGLGN